MNKCNIDAMDPVDWSTCLLRCDQFFRSRHNGSRHDRMIALVKGMLAFHKQSSTVRAGYERTAIQRQIEATDRQIDRLVYKLYGLTEDEIKIVEEALSPSNSSKDPDPALS